MTNLRKFAFTLGLAVLLSSVQSFCPLTTISRQTSLERRPWSDSSTFLPRPTTCLDASTLTELPRIQPKHLEELAEQGYVIIPDFISSQLQQSLREDVANLRSQSKFRVAKIGQDATNTLNQEIRVAETCFLGSDKKDLPASEARTNLYQVLSQVREDLSLNPLLNKKDPLDGNLEELLYAYYPKGGFYRRHVDAVANSASVLRSYSLLLYLNQDWTPADGGQLRIHRDSGGDYLPPDEEPNFVDVEPLGGTLVLFESDRVPHEVLDTGAERVAVVGWYNRVLKPEDIAALGGGDAIKSAMMVASAALVTAGLAMIITQ